MAKSKRPQWFRVYLTSRSTLDSIDSTKLGDALKAALKYFDEMGRNAETEKRLADTETRIAFATIKQGIDDSLDEYAERVEDGKKGAAEKQRKVAQAAIEQYIREYGGNEPIPTIESEPFTENVDKLSLTNDSDKFDKDLQNRLARLCPAKTG